MSSHPLTKIKRKAQALFQQRRWVEAKAAYKKICAAAPEDAGAWLDYGVATGTLGEYAEAEAAFRRALQLNPHLPQGYFNLGKLLVLLGRMHEAEGYWRTYVDIMPGLAEGQYQMAKVLMTIGRLAESLPYFQEALRLAPDAVEVMLDYGNALQLMGRYVEAESALSRVLALKPNHAPAYLRLAHLHTLRRQFAPAAEALRLALVSDPALRGAVLHQAATTAKWQGDFTAAARYYDQALALQPDNSELRWERSLNLLRLGRYQEGWREYETRTRYAKWLDVMSGYKFSQPRWDGGPLQGRTILIYAEQGFGDTLQFSRYLPLVAERGAEVIFYCHEELLRLMRRMDGVAKVAPRSEKILTEQFAVHAPLMSLPHLFDTRLETIPARVPYLSAAPDLVAHWRARLDPARPKVGLAWAGRPTYLEDYWRSMRPQDLAPLAGVGSVKYYSLQKDAVADAPLNIEDLSGELRDFADTAAVIGNLDLVITVDTAVAHLAGALGRPVWTLLHFPPDWRWLLEREDSPWYPTMRLFRRAADEDWAAVTRRVAAALAEWVAARAR